MTRTIPVSEDFVLALNRTEAPFRPEEAFGRVAPLEIEIGCGKGLFLRSAAATRPGHDFIGIEIATKYFKWAARGVEYDGLENVRLLREEGGYFLERYVRPASVARVHLYYPDPWPKRRHRKRRIFDEAFLSLVRSRLVPGGLFFAATDFEDYWQQMEKVIAGATGMRTVEGEAVWDGWETNFGRKYAREKRSVYRACLERIPDGGDEGTMDSTGAAGSVGVAGADPSTVEHTANPSERSGPK